MRILSLFLLTGGILAQTPAFQPVGSVSQVMISITYPSSDAIFYVERNPPKTEKDWNDLQAQALVLAESGNLLIMGRRGVPSGPDQADWIKEAREMADVGAAAYKAALAKDLPGILALNQRLTDACVACHQQFRPNYRRRRQPAQP